jgi:RimJ/RimL family protein N-acetyltransferase
MTTHIQTGRLELEPISLALVEAVILGRREVAERLADAALPRTWPNRALVERAFAASLDDIRADPERRLWGDRLMIRRGPSGQRLVVGSVVFHGQPEDGIAEIAYGVEDGSQGEGLATEATRACVEWALRQDGVVAVQATTVPWHTASLRVIAKLGMVRVGVRDHEILGELVVFETRGNPLASASLEGSREHAR